MAADSADLFGSVAGFLSQTLDIFSELSSPDELGAAVFHRFIFFVQIIHLCHVEKHTVYGLKIK